MIPFLRQNINWILVGAGVGTIILLFVKWYRALTNWKTPAKVLVRAAENMDSSTQGHLINVCLDFAQAMGIKPWRPTEDEARIKALVIDHQRDLHHIAIMWEKMRDDIYPKLFLSKSGFLDELLNYGDFDDDKKIKWFISEARKKLPAQ